MPNYRYLIIGGGMTAEAAVRGIRELDSSGSIGLLGSEPDPPYSRPPLSKKLWQGKPIEAIWYKTEERGVHLHLGRTATALDPLNKTVTDDHGGVYGYEELLLATGGTPKRLPFGDDDIIYFRTLQDYRTLRALSDARQRFAVIGGGFIGSEVAAALAMNGKQVAMVFPEESIGARIYPQDLSRFLDQYYAGKGVEILSGHTITGFQREGDELTLQLRAEKTGAERSITVDGAVAGLGILPSTSLAEGAGLPVDNGIVVDHSLRAGHANVYAAGDVARFWNPTLEQHIRVEHEDNALTMGRLAGRNMAGEQGRYDHLPYFYSDLFDLGYEAVGILDPRMETVADWVQPYQTGVVYYLRDGRVRGVLLWNVWNRVDAARALMSEPGPLLPSDLIGRL